MKPALVFPLHDPTGLLWDRLPAGLNLLKPGIDRVIIGLSPETSSRASSLVAWCSRQGWIDAVSVPASAPVGAQFRHLYAEAVRLADPEQVVHLCFPDRLLFALTDTYRSQFIDDLFLAVADEPLLFVRSSLAWATHPQVYRDAEGMVTTLGRLLIGRELDFAWCHLALPARDLSDCLPTLRRQDMSVMAELVWHLKDRIRTKAVDWLAWEDPFVLRTDGDTLRSERDASVDELDRRLSYVLPMLDVLATNARAEREPESPGGGIATG